MEVIELIARGGFGRVEKVRDDSGTIIARKAFDPREDVLGAAELSKLKRRFEREVKVQSSLSSDYILPILSYDLDASDPWFTMPLAEKNFFDEIQDAKRSSRVLTNELADILNALEELHALGFAHRDLKPQNILYHNNKWKLSDFGLVLPVVSTTTALTSTDSNWGSLPYCAPEQTIDFKHTTYKADIYAFGAILHDIYGEGAASRIPCQQHTCEGPVGLIIEKCTHVKPENRFNNVTALRGALLTVLSKPTGVSPTPDAEEWIAGLVDIGEWEANKIEGFNRFLARLATQDDLRTIYIEVDEDLLETINSINDDLWMTAALGYCEWAKGGFDFNYCDVVVRRLERIHDLGNYECKAAAVLAAAELGASHNRWFVMRRLFKMCGHDIEDYLAERIAIEILAEGVKDNFLACAENISRSIEDYHPLIRNILK